MARKIEVQIVGDSSSLHKALGNVTARTTRFGNVLGSTFRVGSIAATAGIVGLGYALKRGVEDFSDSQKVAAQTAAVLKSTGGAANVTASHVNDLANSLSAMSGVDDEAIGAGENLLLTFRNVRNEAGKGNDIFDQSTRAILDMSVAMGEDLHSATIQVGKALNDPIKGLTALQRVGVTFTQAQRDQITALVNSGHAMEAQKIILGELHKEFAGSAQAAGDTLAGQLNKLKNAFDNAASAIIAGLLPYVTRLAQFAFPLMVSAMQIVAQNIKTAIHWVGRFADRFNILGNSSQSAGTRVTNVFERLRDFFRANVFPVVHQLQAIFRQSMTQIAAVVQRNGPELQRIFSRIGAAVKAIAQFAIPILRFALVQVLPRAIDIAIKALDKIISIVQSVIHVFRILASHGGPSILDLVGPIQTVISWVNSLISKIQSLIDKINSIPSVNTSGLDVLKGLNPFTAGAGGGGGGGGSIGGAGRPIQVNLHLDGKRIYSSIVAVDKDVIRQNGRSLLGGSR